MSSVENLLISAIVDEGVNGLRQCYSQGVTSSSFAIFDEEFQWIEKRVARRKPVTLRGLKEAHPDFEYARTKGETVADLAQELKTEVALAAMNELMSSAAEQVTKENVLDVLTTMRDRITTLTRAHSPLSDVDLDDYEHVIEEMRQGLALAAQGQSLGILTGIPHIDHHMGGLLPGQFVMLSGRTGSAKRLSLDTRLPTPEGWTTMGDVQVGDKLFDELGQQCSVEWVGEIAVGDSYRVEFSDGSFIYADAEHLWLTETRASRKSLVDRRNKALVAGRPSDRRSLENCAETNGVRNLPSVVTTEEIRKTLRTASGHANHSISTTHSIDTRKRHLPVDPYVLGAWLGDGGFRGTSAHLTSMDDEVWGEIAAVGFEFGKVQIKPNNRAVNRTIIGLGRTLLSVGLSHGDKFIPRAYLRASHDQRLALLQGLLDTDGTITKQGSSVCIGQKSKKLSDDLYELIVSLGMKATRTVREAKIGDNVYAPSYAIRFSPTCQVFRLTRKAERINLELTQVERKTRRYITAVVKTVDVPMRCIRVSSPSHLFLAGDAMIPTHNSYLAIKLGWEARKKGLNVGIFSPEFNEHEVRCRYHTLASADKEVQAAVGLQRSFRNSHLMRRTQINLKSYQRFMEYLREVPGSYHLLCGRGMKDQMSVGYIEDRLVEYELDLVIVDPIYLLKPVRTHQEGNVYQEVAWIGETLHRLSETYDVPIIFTNQAHLDGNKGDAPSLDKSYGAKSLLHISDWVLGVQHMSEENQMIVKATKGRFGEAFRFLATFVADTGFFELQTPPPSGYRNGAASSNGNGSHRKRAEDVVKHMTGRKKVA